jgi:hypothetical protein
MATFAKGLIVLWLICTALAIAGAPRIWYLLQSCCAQARRYAIQRRRHQPMSSCRSVKYRVMEIARAARAKIPESAEKLKKA